MPALCQIGLGGGSWDYSSRPGIAAQTEMAGTKMAETLSLAALRGRVRLL